MKQSRLDFLTTTPLRPIPYRAGECVKMKATGVLGVVMQLRRTIVRDRYGVYLVEVKSDGGAASQQFWHESEMEAV